MKINSSKFLQWFFLSASLAASPVLALEFDVPGKPNESGPAIAEKFTNTNTPLTEIYEYFSHYSPTVRKGASEAMARQGEKAMPFILQGLQSGRKHEIRAACDAISGLRGFFGVNVKDAKSLITVAMAARAVPYIVPLLEHEDMYVRVGALQALSRCGKAAAPHLPRVVKFFNDGEWWLRCSAAYVIQGVGSPEADVYAAELIQAMARESNSMCRNTMKKILKERELDQPGPNNAIEGRPQTKACAGERGTPRSDVCRASGESNRPAAVAGRPQPGRLPQYTCSVHQRRIAA